MSAPVSRLDEGLQYLDALPTPLLRPTLELPRGSLEDRARGVIAWREALLAGRLPSETAVQWQEAALVRGALAELAALDLPRFCANHAELADDVLAGVLESWAHGGAVMGARLRAGLAEIKRLLDEVARKRGGPHRPRAGAAAVDRQLRVKLLMETDALGEQAVRTCLSTAWAERVEALGALEAVFGALGMQLGLGWDLTRALIRSTGWRDLERIRRLLATLPELSEVVRALGRLQVSDDSTLPPVLESCLTSMRRAGEERVDVRLPSVPHDVRGVERTGELSRMLPSEATLLVRSALRKLWHVRRAERALLGYRVEGVMTERRQGDVEQIELHLRPQKPSTRGPMIVCLDTSGSMAGTPERVAKAIVLEVARVAHSEKRACYVYAFSGPGDVAELSLRLDPTGLGLLMDLLQSSFHGGTDVGGPLRRALSRMDQAEWKRADLLVVTDGEFPLDAEAAGAATRMREAHGARIHGVLVGAHHSASLDSLCTEVHAFSSWGCFGEPSAEEMPHRRPPGHNGLT